MNRIIGLILVLCAGFPAKSSEVCSQRSSGFWYCTFDDKAGRESRRLCDHSMRQCVPVSQGRKTNLDSIGTDGNSKFYGQSSSYRKSVGDGFLGGASKGSSNPYMSGQHGEGPGQSLFEPGSFGPNGPIVAGAILGTVGTIANAIAKLHISQEERQRKYSAFSIPVGLTDEQKARSYEAFKKEMERNIEKANKMRAEAWEKSPVVKDLRNSVQRLEETLKNFAKKRESLKELIEHLQSQEGPKDTLRVKLPYDTEGLTEEEKLFLVESTLKSESLKLKGIMETGGSTRWKERAGRAFDYWTKEQFRNNASKLELAPRAREQFGLPDIISDSLENYEVIRAANLLARQRQLTSDPILRLNVALFLKQAQLFAMEGEKYAMALMLENAMAMLDFVKGILTGAELNLVDMASGMWHLLSHPIDSAGALASAVVNYEKTWDAVVSKAQEVRDNYDSYSLEDKGQLIGYLATEIAATVFTGGGKIAAEIAKSAKIAHATEVALENAIKILKNPTLNRFEAGFALLSDLGKSNVEFLRTWAKERGYVQKIDPTASVESWGVWVGEKFEWRVRIKSNPGIMEGLHPESIVPRASVRTAEGKFFNPYTDEQVSRIVGSHLPLEFDWFSGGLR